MMSVDSRSRLALRALSVGLVSVAVMSVALTQRCAGQKKVARLSGDSAESKHVLAPAIRTARESAKTLGKFNDYTALFRKMEVVKGKRLPSTMEMKFRGKPFSVYLLFKGENAGQEVIYVDGQNDGKLIAHAGGVKGLITLKLKPNSARAMRDGRYPITRIGMAKMLEGVITQWENELRYDSIKVAYYPDAKLFDPGKQFAPMECKVFESRHLRRRRGVQFQITRLYIDKKTNLPARVEQYGFPVQRGGKPVLLEEYTYWNVRPNVGLKATDFDRSNPDYKF